MTGDTPRTHSPPGGAAPAAQPPRRRLGANFWKLWSSSALSNLADGLLKVSLPLVAVLYTDSPALVAGVTFALTIPWLFFALPAGALADRIDRRRAMLGANIARTVVLCVLALALALDLGSIWALYAAAFVIGATETVYDSTAQSILPQIVSRDRLSRANGRLFAAELTANQFVGPPLGGLLVAVGVAVSFTAPAALWAAAVGVLLLLRGRFRVERAERATVRADVVEGLRFLWRNRVLRWLAVLVGVGNFANSAVYAVLVLFVVGANSPMGLSEPGFGALLTTLAVGSLLGSFAAEHVQALLGRARTLALAMAACAVYAGVPAVSSHIVLVGAGFLVGGFAVAVWNVITVSLRQRITPDRLLGRVNSGYRLVGWGTMPLGAATGGLLAEFFGLTAVFASMALLTLGLVLVLFVVTDARMEQAEREADTAEPSGGDTKA